MYPNDLCGEMHTLAGQRLSSRFELLSQLRQDEPQSGRLIRQA